MTYLVWSAVGLYAGLWCALIFIVGWEEKQFWSAP